MFHWLTSSDVSETAPVVMVEEIHLNSSVNKSNSCLSTTRCNWHGQSDFSVYRWLVKKCLSIAGHISNINPQEDVLQGLGQNVWLRLRRAVCVGNWSSSRGMTLSLDPGSLGDLGDGLGPHTDPHKVLFWVFAYSLPLGKVLADIILWCPVQWQHEAVSEISAAVNSGLRNPEWLRNRQNSISACITMCFNHLSVCLSVYSFAVRPEHWPVVPSLSPSLL